MRAQRSIITHMSKGLKLVLGALAAAVVLAAALMLAFGLPVNDPPGMFPKRTESAAPSPAAQTAAGATGAPDTPAASPVATASAVPTPAPADDGRVQLADGFYFIELNDEIKERITGFSYPEDDTDIAINYADLRYVKLLYYDFNGNVKEGELIVNAQLADEVTEIFYELYQAKYPFTSINLVDDYGQTADDELSMEANNTSAFNYRPVAGTSKLSFHSFGAAIDINPLLNPYIKADGSVYPLNALDYVDRSRDFPGKIDHDDLAYKLFTARGWDWGGNWTTSKDYQHFAKDLGFDRG